MKLIKVKTIVITPNEKGREKIDRVNSSEEGIPKLDSEGRSAEWYEDMNLPIPPELSYDISTDLNYDGTIPLEDDEINISYNSGFFSLDSFISCVDNNDMGSTIYLKEDNMIISKERSSIIYKKINQRKVWWIEKIFLSLWQKIKKFKKRKANLKTKN